MTNMLVVEKELTDIFKDLDKFKPDLDVFDQEDTARKI